MGSIEEADSKTGGDDGFGSHRIIVVEDQQQEPVDGKRPNPNNDGNDRLRRPTGVAAAAPPPPPPPSWCAAAWTETRLFLELGAGTSLMYLGFTALPLLTASCVGRRFGPVRLTAFSLANLTGNLCTQTLVMGLQGAIDTLGPQAVGKGSLPEVGLLAVRGFVVPMLVLIPINAALVVGLEPLLVAVGEDPGAARLAHRWYRIYAASLPFSVLYGSVCKFLTVQNITAPIAAISVALTLLIGPALEVSAGALGFLGTAVAYVGFWMAASGWLVIYVWWKRPHDPRTWPRGGSRNDHAGGGSAKPQESSSVAWSLWTSSMEWAALREFVVLGLGGVVAQCEWIFWEALGLLVGKLGVPAMTAHAIPTQIVFGYSNLPLSFGVALAVRMGTSLPTNVSRARGIAVGVVAAAVVLSWIASVVLYNSRDVLIRFFLDAGGGGIPGNNEDDHNDHYHDDNYNDHDHDDDASPERVYDLAESIWPEVSVFNFSCNMFLILAGVSSGLGKQWALGTINVVFLWVLGMPIIYYTAIVERHEDDDDGGSGGLETIWFWMNLAYAGINLSLLWFLFFRTDWYEVQAAILEEEDAATAGAAEEPRGGAPGSAPAATAGGIVSSSKSETPAAPDERTALLRRPPSQHRD